METRKKKSFKRLFAFLMAFVMVTTLAASAIFAAEPTFKDVPADYEFYDEIEDLAAKDIIGGYGTTGLFKPEEKLTRAQAAKMIAKAADIEVSKGFKTSFTDIDEDVDMYEHIWALEEAKIVKGWGTTKEFRPDEAIERGHVAKMVALAFGLADGSVDVEFKDLPKDEEVADAIMALATNDIVKGYGTSGEFRPEEPVLRGQFSKMVSRAMNLELEIVEAKALDLKNVELSFNKSKEIAKLARSDVKIVDAKTSAVQIVKAVKVKGAVASVELYNALTAKSTYDVEVTVGTKVLKAQFAIGDLAPVTIKADALQIVSAGVPTEVEYEVFDAYGLDLTDDYPADEVTFTSPAVDSDGKVTLGAGTSAVTKIQIWDGTKLLAESEDITLKAEALKAAEIAAWTIGQDNWNDPAYEQITEMSEAVSTNQIKALVLDQFEDEFVAGDVEFTSLDVGVAIVDKVTGLITPVKVGGGSLPIRIDVVVANKVVLTKTVVVTITAKAKLTSMKLDVGSLTISDKDVAGEIVKVELLDQYLKTIASAGTTSVAITPLADASSLNVSTPNLASGKADVTIKAAASDAKAGTYVVEFEHKEGSGASEIKVSAKLTVVIAKAGTFASYEVRGLVPKIDKNGYETEATASKPTPKTMDIKVVPIDSNGLAVGDKVTHTLKFRDKDDDPVASVTTFDGLVVGKYTVEVYVGSILVKEYAFEVVDTTPVAKPTVVFTDNEIELTEGNKIDALLQALNGIAEVNGVTTGAKGTITGVKFISNNTNVVPTNLADDDEVAEGDAIIYISEVTVAGAGADGGPSGKVEFANYPISVKVVEVDEG